jgi:AraC-like DNA-binding protein
MECGAALVKADAFHEIDASATQILLAWVDPQSDLGAALLQTLKEDITVIKDDAVALWRSQLGARGDLTSAQVESWIRRSFLCVRRAPRLHPRVHRVLQVIREELSAGQQLSLKRMAAIAGLSDSRFMHVFTESVGVPLRPYVLWLRLQSACGEMMAGANLTQAAHRAGFADAAHFKPNGKTNDGDYRHGPHPRPICEACRICVGFFDDHRLLFDINLSHARSVAE